MSGQCPDMSSRMRIERPDGSSFELDEETTKQLHEVAKVKGISPQAALRQMLREEWKGFLRVN